MHRFAGKGFARFESAQAKLVLAAGVIGSATHFVASQMVAGPKGVCIPRFYPVVVYPAERMVNQHLADGFNVGALIHSGITVVS